MPRKKSLPNAERPARKGTQRAEGTQSRPETTAHSDVQTQPLAIRNAEGRLIVLFKIDQVILSPNSVLVRGWSHGDVNLDLQVAGSRPNWRVEREARPDVSKALGILDADFATGFAMRAAIAPGSSSPSISMDWRSGDHHGQSNLNVTRFQPEGKLESVNNDLSVSGWTVVRGLGATTTIDLYLNGTKVAEGEVDSFRPDLIAAGLTREKAGFRLTIPPETLVELENEVDVRVCGQSISRQPFSLSLASQVSVEIVRTTNGQIELEVNGWPGRLSAGSIVVDGKPKIGIPFGEISLVRNGPKITVTCPLPAELCDGQLHSYSAQLHFGKSVVTSDTKLLRYPDYGVFVDNATMSSISGWVFRRDQDRAIRLGVFCASEMVGEGSPDLERMDVQSAHNLRQPNVGFHIDLYDLPVSSQVEYVLRDMDTGITLASVGVSHKFDVLRGIARTLALGSTPDRIALRSAFAGNVISSQDAIGFSFREFPIQDASAVPSEVSVVIPVYGGASATAECIESVLAAKNRTAAQVILVNDCSPDLAIVGYLRSLSERKLANVVVIHRTQNGGFSHSVNIGMAAAGRRNVILLNADTVVQDGWIDKLVHAANQDDRIATVTPLSNNGEIVTVPYMCESLPIATSDLAISVDQAASRVNKGKIVDIPVAIGFCMFIRRACIDDVGLFDAATWGRGYGEEVDFCVKATSLGWRHVAAIDTFVVHRGNVSFGAEKLERVLESSKKISAKYPFYDSLIQRFLVDDPMAKARRDVSLELIRRSLPKRRVLHLSHGFGGGTDQYVRDIAALYKEEGAASIFLRFSANGHSVMEFDIAEASLRGFFHETHSEKYRKNEVGALQTDIESLNIERIHLHAAFGVPRDLLDWIASHFEFDITVHDYAWLCPRVTLTYPGGIYCGEPEPAQCNQCVARYQAHPGLKHWIDGHDGDVDSYRKYFNSVFDKASSVYAGSADVAKRLHSHGIKKRIKAAAHPAPTDSPFLKMKSSTPKEAPSSSITRVAIFGAISDIKGFALLRSCVEAASSRRLPLEFVVFGYTMDDAQILGFSNVKILGKYEDGDLESLVEKIRPHVSLFLHQWPETYSYTLSHSQRLGIWPISLDIGAPAERIRATDFGSIIAIEGRTLAEITDSLLTCVTTIHTPPLKRQLLPPASSLDIYRKTKAM